MQKIDKKNKLCIYLDQFVIGDILEGKNALWLEIKKLIELSYVKGLIYCPLSMEHVLETVRKDISDAKQHDAYYRTISDNYFFKSEPFLTAQLISSLIRKNKKTINTFLSKPELKEIDDVYPFINSDHKKFSSGLNKMLQSQNDFRKILHNKMTPAEEIIMMDAITNSEIDTFKTRLKEYIDQKSLIIRSDHFGTFSAPNWIDQLLFQLTNKHKFKKKELLAFLSELNRNGFSRIPSLHIKFSLGAYLAVKNKNENSGDHIDIMRIASYLFSSDIFFTDKKRKYEICDLGLDKKYKTEVFSGTQNDLMQVRDLLINLNKMSK